MRASAEIQQAAKGLRQESTRAEQVLWERLRNRQAGGFKFRRQHPIGRCIVDFYCAEARLVIEIDGDIHQTQKEYDNNRTKWLEERGYRVARFQNERVLSEIETVMSEIIDACNSPHPCPSPVGEMKDDPNQSPHPCPSPASGRGGRG